MSQEMLDLCGWAVTEARKAGADECKVSVDRSRFVEIAFRDRKPETIKEAAKQRVSLEVYVNRRYSAQTTSDIRRAPLGDFIRNAVAMTKLLAEDPFRNLPDPKYYQGRAIIDLKLADPAFDNVTSERRQTLVKSIEDACLTEGGSKVVSVTAGCRDELSESAVMTSNDFSGYFKATEFWAGAQMTAKDEGDRRPAGYHWVGHRMHGDLADPGLVGKTAAQRTLAQLGAKKLKTETLPVILENRGVTRVGSGLIQALFAQSIQQKQSFLADKKGQKIGSELLTAIDGPLLPGGLGSCLFDSDGFATRKRTIFDQGVLRDFYVDWYYGRKLGWEPTTGGPTNLIVPPGKRSVAEIMKDLGRGILITDFLGGNSNSTTGDFSIGISGRLFENGVSTQPVAEMNIADNHLRFWQKLIEVANDPWLYDSTRTPSLVFKDVVVSGA